MAVSFRLKVDLNQESLTEAAEFIRLLQEHFGELPPDDGTAGPVLNDPDRPSPAPPVAVADVAGQVERWLAHLGPGSRSFWRLAAEFARDHAQFTLEELSQHSGIPKATLRSYHRNSYRAIHDEQAADPLPGVWDAQLRARVYRMADGVREEILELTQDDPT